MKLRKVTAIIAAAVMMMSLAACGSSNDEGGSEAETADLLQVEASTSFPVRTVPEQEELS